MAINIKPSHKGLLHKELKVKVGQPISTAKLKSAAKTASPAEKKRIVFAENARKWNHADPGSGSHPKMHTSKDH